MFLSYHCTFILHPLLINPYFQSLTFHLLKYIYEQTKKKSNRKSESLCWFPSLVHHSQQSNCFDFAVNASKPFLVCLYRIWADSCVGGLFFSLHTHVVTCVSSITCFLLLLSRSVVSNSLWPHGLQHSRPSCPSLCCYFTIIHHEDNSMST